MDIEMKNQEMGGNSCLGRAFLGYQVYPVVEYPVTANPPSSLITISTHML
jgi:hypothetical protein